MRKERKTERNHLSLKAKLADEVAQGLHPELEKDLLAIKFQGLDFENKTITKKEALQVLMKQDRDFWELFIVFGMIPSKYAQILS